MFRNVDLHGYTQQDRFPCVLIKKKKKKRRTASLNENLEGSLSMLPR